jgi:sulfite oxidase
MTPGDKTVCVHDGAIHLEGWAYSGNGNWPERVEVSPDGCAGPPHASQRAAD